MVVVTVVWWLGVGAGCSCLLWCCCLTLTSTLKLVVVSSLFGLLLLVGLGQLWFDSLCNVVGTVVVGLTTWLLVVVMLRLLVGGVSSAKSQRRLKPQHVKSGGKRNVGSHQVTTSPVKHKRGK